MDAYVWTNPGVDNWDSLQNKRFTNLHSFRGTVEDRIQGAYSSHIQYFEHNAAVTGDAPHEIFNGLSMRKFR